MEHLNYFKTHNIYKVLDVINTTEFFLQKT